jgi:hypothetical protein
MWNWLKNLRNPPQRQGIEWDFINEQGAHGICSYVKGPWSAAVFVGRSYFKPNLGDVIVYRTLLKKAAMFQIFSITYDSASPTWTAKGIFVGYKNNYSFVARTIDRRMFGCLVVDKERARSLMETGTNGVEITLHQSAALDSSKIRGIRPRTSGLLSVSSEPVSREIEWKGL